MQSVQFSPAAGNVSVDLVDDGIIRIAPARAIWNRYGGVNGRLGYLTSEPTNGHSPGSWAQKFQGGTIQHMPACRTWSCSTDSSET
jgi:hypothetical protein